MEVFCQTADVPGLGRVVALQVADEGVHGEEEEVVVYDDGPLRFGSASLMHFLDEGEVLVFVVGDTGFDDDEVDVQRPRAISDLLRRPCDLLDGDDHDHLRACAGGPEGEVVEGGVQAGEVGGDAEDDVGAVASRVGNGSIDG